MNKLTKGVLLGILASAFAGQAFATTGWWAVDWFGSTRTIHVNLANYATNGGDLNVNIGAANGRFFTQSSGGPWTQFEPVYCVDMFNVAYDNWSNRYDVDWHTGADGEAGWRTPAGDSDEYRAVGGLGRAAALVRKYGSVLSTDTDAVLNAANDSDRYNRSIALNVAIWKASYGTNFTLRNTQGNMTTAQYNYYLRYKAYYDTGATLDEYYWFDSRSNDGTSHRQDFITDVPEPGSLLLLGGLLLGSALVTRRRRKQA